MQLRRQRSTGKHGEGEGKAILAEGRDVRQWVLSARRDASNKEAADAFLDEICRCSGLLPPRGEDQFAFTHLSFQEFFAAVFFVSQFVRSSRARSSIVSGTGNEEMHTYIEKEMWHETFVFFVELIFAEQPNWLEELLFRLFSEGFDEITPRISIMKTGRGQKEPADAPKLGQAILLARLSVDPHTGLAELGLKSDAIARCCAFEAVEQKRMQAKIEKAIKQRYQSPQPEILKVLLGADREEIPQVWRAFTNIWCETGLRALCPPFAPNFRWPVCQASKCSTSAAPR